MDTETELKRSVFLGVRQQQQIHKYECENTYTIYIKNSDDVSYVDGATAHNSFKVHLDSIGKEHIKSAKVKVKSLRLPTETTAGANFKGDVFIRSSIGKNTIVNGGLTAGIIGSAYIKEAVTNTEVVVPKIESHAGIPTGGGAISKNATGNNAGIITNGAGGSVNINTIGAFADNMRALVGVRQENGAGTANYSLSRQINKGCVGWCSDIETLCENPFGKDIQFDILTNDITTLQETGQAAGDGTTIVLEVELLPDYRENDRLNY